MRTITLNFPALCEVSQLHQCLSTPREVLLWDVFDNNVAGTCNEVNVTCQHLHEDWVVDNKEYRGVTGELDLASCRKMVPGPPIDVVALDQLLYILEDPKLCLGQRVQWKKFS
jgi:hypothetical protein